MKKQLFFFFFLCFSLFTQAAINIKDGGKYRIACQKYPTGYLVLGEQHDMAPLLFYATNLTAVPDDGWWIVSKKNHGYALRNAKTNQYMVYKEGRLTNAYGQYTAKGIQLADNADDDDALWQFTETESGFLIVENCGQAGQYFNLRTDGTYLLGTYSSAGTENCFFQLYDETGKAVVSSGSDQRPTEGLFAYIDSLRIGGKDITYDSYNNAFFLSLSQQSRETGTYSAPVRVKWAECTDLYRLRIAEEEIPNNGNLEIKNISCESPYTIEVVNQNAEVVASAPLNMTFLPLVEIQVKTCNSKTYTKGTFRVTDPEDAGYDQTLQAAFRYRGASSTNYAKKSYAVKLYDADGQSLDQAFFGLRDDNNWILDAMYIDEACMRNRVSTDLWNDFATKPYHQRNGWENKVRTGTRGHFVEVFLNGRYHGLYCMTEKMDRKQLKLKKFVPAQKSADGTALSADTIHGTLYKAVQWTYEVFMGGSYTYPSNAPRAYNNNARQEGWAGYEIKYPDWEDEKIDWGPLWNAINFVATSEEDVFDNEVKTYFDYPVIRDYYLFTELMVARDNRGKNMYFFNYDQKSPNCTEMIGIAPWDLDATWGISWDGLKSEKTVSNFNYADYILSHTLYNRLTNSSKWNWTEDLKERYAELRQSVFTADALTERFMTYGDLFEQSGAFEREHKRWNGFHTDLNASLEYIKQWIAERLAFLDKQYNYTPVVDGIQQATSDDVFVCANGGKNSITLHATTPTVVRIYTLGGQLIRTISLTQPTMEINGLAAGIYLVNQQKVIVK